MFKSGHVTKKNLQLRKKCSMFSHLINDHEQVVVSLWLFLHALTQSICIAAVAYKFRVFWSWSRRLCRLTKWIKLTQTEGKVFQIKSENTASLQPTTLTKQADVDLLQRVDAAELVELVVNLVEYQGFIVICCEVPHYVVHCREGNRITEHGNRWGEVGASCFITLCLSVPDTLSPHVAEWPTHDLKQNPQEQWMFLTWRTLGSLPAVGMR